MKKIIILEGIGQEGLESLEGLERLDGLKQLKVLNGF